MRTLTPLTLIATLALAACAPPAPPSDAVVVRGPAFDTPAQAAAREREALLRGPTATPSEIIAPPAAAPGTLVTEGNAIGPPLGGAGRIGLGTRGALGAPPPPPPPGAPLPVGTPQIGTTTLGAGLDRDNPAISREQDFGAVSAERSIEDDAARQRAAREQFQVITPEPLQRPADTGPNVIAYALEQARPVGQAGAYRRGITASVRAAERRCREYPSADDAQSAFLGAGGPQRDRLGLDPDGDGNACTWNPAAYRGLVRN